MPYVSHGARRLDEYEEYEEEEYIKRKREKTYFVSDLDQTVTDGMKLIYREARNYYTKYPEHKWLHGVIFLWTLMLFTILT